MLPMQNRQGKLEPIQRTSTLERGVLSPKRNNIDPGSSTNDSQGVSQLQTEKITYLEQEIANLKAMLLKTQGELVESKEKNCSLVKILEDNRIKLPNHN
jgi:hypothetical protein